VGVNAIAKRIEAMHSFGEGAGGEPRSTVDWREWADGNVRLSAARAGLPMAEAYWPCLLSWVRPDVAAGRLAPIREAMRAWDGRNLLLAISRASQLLLLADESGRGVTRAQLTANVSRVVRAARGEKMGAGVVRAVIGHRIGPDERLGRVATVLHEAAGDHFANSIDGVSWARDDAVARLMEHIDAHWATGFVEQQLGAIEAHDRRHGTTLERVLELALDHADRGAAADAAFMHRNTFRRQYRKALELLGSDLDCPEERLAVHLALKMRALELHR